MKSFFNGLSIQLQSKRTWASIVSIVTLFCTLWFPDKLGWALGIVATLQSWAVSDSNRPAVSKFTKVTDSEKPFEVPEKVLTVLREAMVEHAVESVTAYNTKQVLIEVPKNDVN